MSYVSQESREKGGRGGLCLWALVDFGGELCGLGFSPSLSFASVLVCLLFTAGAGTAMVKWGLYFALFY